MAQICLKITQALYRHQCEIQGQLQRLLDALKEAIKNNVENILLLMTPCQIPVATSTVPTHGYTSLLLTGLILLALVKW